MSSELGGATLTDARYRGVDEQGRPYTLTAATAQQVGPERINLTTLKADITLADGTWLMLQSKHGVFLQHTNQLDLSHDVTLYRDDGTTMTTASASIDLKNGAAAGAEPTHAEGPFGTLDAQGFTITDKGTAIQFTGPAHLVLNGHRHEDGVGATRPVMMSFGGRCGTASCFCRRTGLAATFRRQAQQLDLSRGGPIAITASDGIEWRQDERQVIARGNARRSGRTSR